MFGARGKNEDQKGNATWKHIYIQYEGRDVIFSKCCQVVKWVAPRGRDILDSRNIKSKIAKSFIGYSVCERCVYVREMVGRVMTSTSQCDVNAPV